MTSEGHESDRSSAEAEQKCEGDKSRGEFNEAGQEIADFLGFRIKTIKETIKIPDFRAIPR